MNDKTIVSTRRGIELLLFPLLYNVYEVINMKRILVIYATYGSGHKAIANYIKDYFLDHLSLSI